MEKINKRIHFEDRGQDFLYFDVSYDKSSFGTFGKVVDAQPFQSGIWTKYCALNTPKPGGFLSISESPRDPVIKIKYVVTKVENL